jgi:predicted porin
MILNRRAMVLAVGAALAAPGAYAQIKSPAGTDWEFYGKFYPELTHMHGEGATAPGTTGLSTLVGTLGGNAIIPRWEMQVSNTYLGFRGGKDIGRGLKAIWQLEQQVNIDEGNQTTSFATRNSFAGLAGGEWGTFRLGNMDTPYKEYGNILGFLGVNSGNFVSQSNVLQKVGFGTSSASSFNLRRANAIDFTSPTILGGLQTKVQYSIGNPTEAGISVANNRSPRVVSWGAKWEQGPFLVAFAQESHLDLFGGSLNAPNAPPTRRNDSTGVTDNAVRSVDTANQLAVVYKIGVHSIEADFVQKRYKEKNVTVNGRFQEYKNNAYMLILESRWSGTWRTAVHYIKASAGSCTLLNTACTTDGLDGNQIDVGVAYYLDPTVYIFGLFSKLTNGDAARYNSSSQSPAPGEDITQGGVGIAYTF